MKRTISLLLSVIMLLSTVTPAFADFSLPSQLRVVENEAFAGAKYVKGNVTLPSGVSEVGDRAFADTGVYALTLPSGTKNVGEGVLDGTDAVYAEIPGMTTQLAPGAFDLPYVLGREGSAAERWAGEEGATFLDSTQIMKSGGFAYLYRDKSYKELSLLFPLRRDISGEVTIPSHVDGRPVVGVGAYAFTQLSGVTKINLPDTVFMPEEGERIAWPDAQIETYAVSTGEPVLPDHEGAEEIELNVSDFTANVGDRFELYWPEQDGDFEMTAYSSDEDVAVHLGNRVFDVRALGDAYLTLVFESREDHSVYYGVAHLTVEEPELEIYFYDDVITVPQGARVDPYWGFRRNSQAPLQYPITIEAADEDVIAVEANEWGTWFTIVGLKAGETTLTISSQSAGVTASASVPVVVTEVTETPDLEGAQEIPMDVEAITLNPGETFELAEAQGGLPATNGWYTRIYLSDNEDAVVCEGSTIEAVGLGQATVTMVVMYETGEVFYGTTEITVKEPSLEIVIHDESPMTLMPAQCVTLTWEAIRSSDLPLNMDAFTLSDEGEGRIRYELREDGELRVTGLEPGSVLLTIEGEDAGLTASAQIEIVIEEDLGLPENAERWGMNYNELRVNPGDEIDLWFTEELPEPDGGWEWNWFSTNEDAVIHHEDGRFEVVGTGDATIGVMVPYEDGRFHYGLVRVTSDLPEVDVFFEEDDHYFVPRGTEIWIGWDHVSNSDLETNTDFWDYISNTKVVEPIYDADGWPLGVRALETGLAHYVVGMNVNGAWDEAELLIEVYEPDVMLDYQHIYGYQSFSYPIEIVGEVSEDAVIRFYSEDESVATVTYEGTKAVITPVYYEDIDADDQDVRGTEIIAEVTYPDGSVAEGSCYIAVSPWGFEFEDVESMDFTSGITDVLYPELYARWFNAHSTSFTLSAESNKADVLSYSEATDTIHEAPLATGHKPGRASVTYTATFTEPTTGEVRTASKTVEVTVHAPHLEAYLGEDYIEFDEIGDYKHMDYWWEAQVEPKRFTFISSDTSVVTVDSDGTIRAVGPGEATVTFTIQAAGAEASAEVEVLVRGTAVTLNATEITLMKGETFLLAPNLDIAGGEELDTHFYSTDESVVSASWTGVIVGMNAGTAAVVYSGRVGDTSNMAICVVHVIDPDALMTLDKTYLELGENERGQITPIFPEGAVVTDLTFESSEPDTIAVDENGVVTMVGGTGHLTHYPYITVSAVVGGVKVSANCAVRSRVWVVRIGGTWGHIGLEVGDREHVWYEAFAADPDLEYTIEITSDNEEIARVIDGENVLAVSKGVTELVIRALNADGDVIGETFVPVFVETDPPIPEGIAFTQDHYFVNTTDDSGQEYTHIGWDFFPADMWRFWGDVKVESLNEDIVRINGDHIQGVSEGTTQIAVTMTYWEGDEEKTFTDYANVTVSDLFVTTDKDVYEMGEVATLTIEGFPEDLDYEFIRWTVHADARELRVLTQDTNVPQIQLRANQPGEYDVNVDIRIDGEWWHNFDLQVICEGEWNDYELNVTDLTAAVGETFWVGPFFDHDGCTSVSSNPSVIAISEDDPCMLTALSAGEAQITYTFTLHNEEGEEYQIERTANITVIEPDWEILGYGSIPAFMVVGGRYWCVPEYRQAGFLPLEEYMTLSIDEASDGVIARISEHSHVDVEALAPGRFTLTVVTEFGGMTHTMSREILVVEPSVRPAQEHVTLSQGETFLMDMIPGAGFEIESINWRSSDPSMAEVDDTGLVRVFGAYGLVVITADVAFVGGSTATASYYIKVESGEQRRLNLQSETLTPGNTFDIYFEDELPYGDGWNYWEWKSSDPSVVKHMGNGTFKVVGTGEASVILKVTYEDGRLFTGVARIKSVEPSLDIWFEREVTNISIGEKSFFPWDYAVNGWFEDGFTFYTDNEDVIAIETDGENGHAWNAWITGLKEGTATLYIRGSHFGAEDVAEMTVNVGGDEIKLNTYAIWGYGGFDYPIIIEEELPDDAMVGFTSSDEDVAAVDEDGVIHINPDVETEEPVIITVSIAYSDGTKKSAEVELMTTPFVFEFNDWDSLEMNAGHTEGLWLRLRTSWWSHHAGCYELSAKSHDPSILSFSEPTHTIHAVPQATAYGAGEVEVTYTAKFTEPNLGETITIEKTIPVYVHAPYLGVWFDEGEVRFGRVGEFRHVNANIDTDSPFIESIVYASNDPSVAAVDAEGKITAVAAGETDISCTVGAYGAEETAWIHVIVEGWGAALNESEITIRKGESFQLVPTLNALEGANIDTDFDSANRAIANVDWTGLVTGLSAGTTKVTFTGRIDDHEEIASCIVHVVDDAPVIALSENYKELYWNESFTLTASFPEGAEVTDVVFENDDPNTLAMEQQDERSAVITMLGATHGYDHYPVITVTATVDGEQAVAYCTVRSTDMKAVFTWEPGAIFIGVGESQRVQHEFAVNDPEDGCRLVYTMEDEEIAVYNENGFVRGLSVGTTTLIARIVDEDGHVICEDRTPVHVGTDISAPEDITIAFPQEHYFVGADGFDSNWQSARVDLYPTEMWKYFGNIFYETEDPDIAQAYDNNVHGMNPGTTTLTATMTYRQDGEEKQMTATTLVSAVAPELVFDQQTYFPGDIATLRIDGLPEDVDCEIRWDYWRHKENEGAIKILSGLEERELKVLVRQPEDFWFGVDVRLGDFGIGAEAMMHCEGEWDEYPLTDTLVTAAVGETLEIRPEFHHERFRSESDNTDVVVVDENDFARLMIVGAGEATVTYYIDVYIDGEETTIGRTVHITALEPEWEIRGWDNAPSIMVAGSCWWCGPDEYTFNGYDDFRGPFCSLTIEGEGSENVAMINEHNHLEVIALDEGTFTLILTAECGGRTETWTKEITVVCAPVRIEHTQVALRPGESFTNNFITAEGVEIESVRWAGGSEGKVSVNEETGSVYVDHGEGYALVYADVTLVGGETVRLYYRVYIIPNHEVSFEYERYDDQRTLSAEPWGEDPMESELELRFHTNAHEGEVHTEWFFPEGADMETVHIEETEYRHGDKAVARIRANRPGWTQIVLKVWVENVYEHEYWFNIDVYEPRYDVWADPDYIELNVGDGCYVNFWEEGENVGPVRSDTLATRNQNIVLTDVHGNIKAVGPGETQVVRWIELDGRVIEVPVSVKVNGAAVFTVQPSDTMNVGERMQVTAYMENSYDDLEIHGYNFESWTKDVADVTSDGVVYALKPGKAMLRVCADTTHGSFYKEFFIEVLGEPAQESIRIVNSDTDSHVLMGDHRYQLTVESAMGEPDSVSWTSEGWCNVDENGEIHVHDVSSEGYMLVTCEAVYGDQVYTAQYGAVTAPRMLRIVEHEMGEGRWINLSVDEWYTISENISCTDEGVGIIREFTSSDPEVVEVDNNGSIHALSQGEALITLTVKAVREDEEGSEIVVDEVSASLMVRVGMENIQPESIVAREEVFLMRTNWDPAHIGLGVLPLYSVYEWEYEGYDEEIISIENDHIAAHRAGRTTVTARIKGTDLTSEFDVVVLDDSVRLVQENGSDVVAAGSTVQLAFENAPWQDEDIEWIRADNNDGAYVMSDDLTLECRTTQSWEDQNVGVCVRFTDGHEIWYYYNFRVEAPEKMLIVKISGDMSPTLYRYASNSLEYEWPSGDFQIVRITSSDPNVATIEDNERVVAHNVGTAKITVLATIDGQSVKDEMIVTVVEPIAPVDLKCVPDRRILRVGETVNVHIERGNDCVTVPHHYYVSGDEEILSSDGYREDWGSFTITAVAPGETTLTAVAWYGDYNDGVPGEGLGAEHTVTITVVGDPAELEHSFIDLRPGQHFTNTLKAAEGETIESVRWYAGNNADLVEVNEETGEIVPTAEEGSALICADAAFADGKTLTYYYLMNIIPDWEVRFEYHGHQDRYELSHVKWGGHAWAETLYVDYWTNAAPEEINIEWFVPMGADESVIEIMETGTGDPQHRAECRIEGRKPGYTQLCCYVYAEGLIEELYWFDIEVHDSWAEISLQQSEYELEFNVNDCALVRYDLNGDNFNRVLSSGLTSCDSSVVSTDIHGNINAVGMGETTVTLTVELLGGKRLEAEIPVRVKGVALELEYPSDTLNVGESMPVTMNIDDSYGDLEVHDVTFSSWGRSIADFRGDTLYAIAPGTAQIFAHVNTNHGSFYKTFTLEVTGGEAPAVVIVNENEDGTVLRGNHQYQLAVYSELGEPDSVVWSAEGCCDIDENGLLTINDVGRNEGITVRCEATYGEETYFAEYGVSVTPRVLRILEHTMGEGAWRGMTVGGWDNVYEFVECTDSSLALSHEYTSSDENVVKVNDVGDVEAVGQGEAFVTYTVTARRLVDGEWVFVESAKSRILIRVDMESPYPDEMKATCDTLVMHVNWDPQHAPIECSPQYTMFDGYDFWGYDEGIIAIDEEGRMVPLQAGRTHVNAQLRNTELTAEFDVLVLDDSTRLMEENGSSLVFGGQTVQLKLENANWNEDDVESIELINYDGRLTFNDDLTLDCCCMEDWDNAVVAMDIRFKSGAEFRYEYWFNIRADDKMMIVKLQDDATPSLYRYASEAFNWEWAGGENCEILSAESSDENVATVTQNDWRVTAHNAGTAEITVTAEIDGEIVTDVMTVKVTEPSAPLNLTCNPEERVIYVGETVDVYIDYNSEPCKATPFHYYVSGDEDILTANGMDWDRNAHTFTGVAPGQTTLTAIAWYGEYDHNEPIEGLTSTHSVTITVLDAGTPAE